MTRKLSEEEKARRKGARAKKPKLVLKEYAEKLRYAPRLLGSVSPMPIARMLYEQERMRHVEAGLAALKSASAERAVASQRPRLNVRP